MDRRLLCAPFPPELIRSRPGSHGKTLTYVPTGAVIERLNAACESWSFTVVEHQEFEGTEVVVLGRLEVEGVIKCAFGGSAVTKDREGNIVSIGDDLKAAASDSLKKAASLLGVPIDGGRAVQRPPETTELQPPQNQRPAPHGDGRSSRPRVLGTATVRQLTALNSASRRQGLDPAQFSDLLVREVGKRDVSLLTREEASQLLDKLNNQNGFAH